MIRGTTPEHIIKPPVAASLIKSVRFTYEQDGNTVVEKTEADCTITDESISVRLTQEDTLRFEESKTVSVQIRILTTGGEVMASEIKSLTVKKTLNDEVLE